MANLQIRNISDELHQQLRETAARSRTTISDLVLAAIERELARTRWQHTLKNREPSDLGTRAATLLQEERDAHDNEQ